LAEKQIRTGFRILEQQGGRRKFFPERAAQIQKQVDKLNAQYQTDEGLRYSKLVSSSETTAEEMLAQAEKFQSTYRNELYRTAANKFAADGKIAEAEKILQNNFTDEQASSFLSQFYINLSYQLIGQRKYDEANSYINRIEDENQRLLALINLANAVYGQNPKETTNGRGKSSIRRAL
jgi:predicted negative regulator of RcsB-dependent stress response